MCMFDKVFASFKVLTCKNLHEKKGTSIDTHNSEVDMYYDLWRRKHMSIDMLEIDMTCIIRLLKYYELELKYPENITHNKENFIHSLPYLSLALFL